MSIKKTKVLVFPPKTNENQYINNIIEVHRAIGCDVEGFCLSQFFNIKLLFRNKFVYLSWLENQTRQRGIIGFLIILVFLFLCKCLRWKIVYVIHNKHSHNLKTKFQKKLNTVAIKIIKKYSYRIVCHGKYFSQANEIYYLPHPLYEKINMKERQNGNSRYFLVFGRMERYKKLEKIIEYLPSETELIIAGRFVDPEYEKIIKSKIEISDTKITLISKYIEDRHLDDLIANSKAVILANDGETSIISGVLYHAISLGAPVITNSSLMIKETGDIDNIIYVDDFRLLTEASEIIDSKISKAKDLDFVKYYKDKLERKLKSIYE